MSVEKFDELYYKLEPKLRRHSSNFCELVCAEEMLVITIT